MSLFRPDEFGMHIASAFFDAWPVVSFTAVRTWDSYPGVAWTDINTADNVYDWSAMDALTSIYSSRSVADAVYTFGYVPAWVGSATSAPTDSAWTKFVTAIVGRYPTIQYWEIWNEPNAPGFWTGTNAQMVNMAAIAAPIIRAAGGLVLSPSPQGSNAYQWLDGFFSAGGLPYIDIVAFHNYTFEAPETFIEDMANMNAMLSARGAISMPLWNTEYSWGDNTWPFGTSDQLKEAYIARIKLLEHSFGIARAFWYGYEIDPWGQLYNRTANELLVTGTAYQNFHDWVVNKDVGTYQVSGSRYTVSVSATAYTAVIAWTDGGPLDFTAPATCTRFRTLEGFTTSVDGGQVVVLEARPMIFEGVPVTLPPPRLPKGKDKRIMLPAAMDKSADWQRGFHTWSMQANRGNINCTGQVTLTPGANTTTVTDARAGVASFIGLMPLTHSAALEKRLAAVVSQGAGMFIIGHTNNDIADRTFIYAIMG